MKRFEEFQSHIALIQTFDLPMKNISKTKAQLSAMILDAKQPKVKRDDEMEFSIPNNLKINKYREVVTFYETTRDYDKSLKQLLLECHMNLLGEVYMVQEKLLCKRLFLNVDVASYYPALMIEYDYLSRNVPNKKKYRQIRDKRLELKAKKIKDKHLLKSYLIVLMER